MFGGLTLTGGGLTVTGGGLTAVGSTVTGGGCTVPGAGDTVTVPGISVPDGAVTTVVSVGDVVVVVVLPVSSPLLQPTKTPPLMAATARIVGDQAFRYVMSTPLGT